MSTYYYLCRMHNGSSSATSYYGTDKEKAESELSRLCNLPAGDFEEVAGFRYSYEIRTSEVPYLGNWDEPLKSIGLR